MVARDKLLHGLKVYGPVRLCDLARLTGLWYPTAGKALVAMRLAGLAVQDDDKTWDLTDAGRAAFVTAGAPEGLFKTANKKERT